MSQIVMITGPASTAERGWLKPAFPYSVRAHDFLQEQSAQDADGGQRLLVIFHGSGRFPGYERGVVVVV